MASIQKRKSSYAVVYSYEDKQGSRRQKWESAPTKKEALKRKAFIEYYQSVQGPVVVPEKEITDQQALQKTPSGNQMTLGEFMSVFVDHYGKMKWSLTTYRINCSTISHYILPFIGDWPLDQITPMKLNSYYSDLLKVPEVATPGKPSRRCVQPAGVQKIHNIIRCALNQALRWGYLSTDKVNPATLAVLPKAEKHRRKVWPVEVFEEALGKAEGQLLGLCMHLAFSCSMRIGEILGLTWDNVFIDEKDIESGNARLIVDKEIRRVPLSSLQELEQKEVYFIFPPMKANATTRLVLKSTKTESSNRMIWIPRTVALKLVEQHRKQQELRAFLGSEYKDYDLVIAHDDGRPVHSNYIRKKLSGLCKTYGYEEVDFHSLRHLSTGYKLKLTRGDVKSVQGDTGHSDPKMVVDTYSRILDEDRKKNAAELEKQFYRHETDSKEVNDSRLFEILQYLSPEQRELIMSYIFR